MGDEAAHVWEEYKYRHQHCWNTIFKLTFAVVTLSALPYTQLTVSCVIGRWTLLLPVLAVALSLFGSLVLYRELRLLSRVRSKYRALEEAKRPGKDRFTFLAMFYLALLSLAASLNIAAVQEWRDAVHAASGGTLCFQLVPSKTLEGKAPSN